MYNKYVKIGKCYVCNSIVKGEVLAKVCLVKGYRHVLLQCPVCESRYFDPLPNHEELNLFYDVTYYNFDREKEEGKGYAFGSKLRKLKKHGRILDIGCATGYFLNGIKQSSSWKVYGTDYSCAAVKHARENLGLDVRQGDIEKVRFKSNYFDYIHVNNVMEHVLDPIGFLTEVRRIIKDDGVFMLSVPNGVADSAGIIRYSKRYSQTARSPNGHIYFLPKDALLKMLDSVGFRVTFAKTYGFKIGLRNLGLLPMKHNWELAYVPTVQKKRQTEKPIEFNNKSKINRFSSYLRFYLGNLKSFVGLHSLGLDFIMYLKPK